MLSGELVRVVIHIRRGPPRDAPNHVAAAAAIHASTGAGRTRLWLLREITTRTATMKIALKKMGR